MLNENFIRTIDIWIKELDRYDFIQLCTQPSPNSWSIGQVYIHLIDNTYYFIEQIKICISTNDNAMEEASPAAKEMFLNNDFPDEILEGPASNLDTAQPGSKEELVSCLLDLKDEIRELEILV